MKGEAIPAIFFGKPKGALKGPVCNVYLAQAFLFEVFEGNLAHLACADHEYFLAVQIQEDLLRELHRHVS